MVQLGQQFGQGWNVVVALDHGGDRTETAHGMFVEPPYRIDDRVIVGVDDNVALVGVAGEMELADAVGRHAVDEGPRVEAVVEAADVDVVDVEQDQAVGALGDGGDEFPLGQRGRLVA